MSNDQADADKLLTPAEVAAMFRVNAKTVTRWARSGRLSAIKTMGGHRRYRLSEVRARQSRPSVPTRSSQHRRVAANTDA